MEGEASMKAQKNHRRFLQGGVALMVMAGAVATTPARAQDAPAPAPDTTAQADGGDILVQARRRSESIEDVPTSVSVLSSTDLERAGVTDTADLTRQLPGAVLVASGPAYLNDIALRGQGGGRLGFSESTTGIYRDGVYVAGGGFGGRSYSKIDFYDIDRVEVYRGPQGALYGRNAVGGAVNVLSRKPVLDYGFRGSIGYSNVDELDVDGTVNLPVSTGVAIRVGGYYDKQTGGFYHDQLTGKVLDNTFDWGARGTIGFGLGTDTTAYLTVEHSRSEAPGYTSIGQNKKLDPDIFVRTNLNSIDRINIDQTQVIGQFNHDFGASDLTIVANYKGRKGVRTAADFDHYLGLNLSFAQLYDAQGENFERYGGEVRWGSTGSGPFTWLAGSDFLTYTSDISSDRTGKITGSSATANTLRRQLRSQRSREQLSSYSVYGLVGYDLTDRLNVTAEARYQIDSKDFRFQQIDLDPTTNEAIPLTNFKRTWHRFLPTVSLNYKLNRQVSFYARVATGYRPGGFNQNPAEGYFNRVPYDPEDIVQGEIGSKVQFHVGSAVFRSQLALFYGKTMDVQQTTTLTATNPAFTLENVGDNRVYGGEFELSGLVPLAGGKLTAAVNVSGAHGIWDKGATIIFQGNTLDLSGKQTPRSRDYIFNINAAYDHPIGHGLTAYLAGSYQKAGGGYDNASLERLSQNYEIANLSVGIKTDRWTLSGYVNNVTNDIYYTVEVSGNDYYNTPRTYGFKLSVDW